MAATDPTVAARSPGFSAPAGRTLRAVAGFFRGLFSSPQSAVGTLLVLFFLVQAVFGPMLAPYTENDQNHPVAAEPSAAYPFGTDHLGRDMFSRTILGARSILVKAGLGTLIAVVAGTVLGLGIGYAGGLLDDAISRVIDAFLALPAPVVEASLRFSYAMFLVASLGFLGVGARPPSPDWGLMVNENRRLFQLTPWALIYPALAISILVVGVNLMSDGIKRTVQRGG